MQFRNTFLAFAFGASALSAMAVPASSTGSVDVGPVSSIAQNAVAACNCPNNCSHTQGSSCKYYADGSGGTVIDGNCQFNGGNPDVLTCVAS